MFLLENGRPYTLLANAYPSACARYTKMLIMALSVPTQKCVRRQHISHIKHTVLYLFNVCSNHAPLNYTGQESTNNCSLWLWQTCDLEIRSRSSNQVCDQCQTSHNCTTATHWALPVHTAFSDLDHISRSQHCRTVLTEIFLCLSS